MGHQNKQTLIKQAQQIFRSKLAIGQSKYSDKKQHCIQDKIYSWSTYRAYMKHACYFLTYCRETYRCNTIAQCRVYINEWLRIRQCAGLSAYTVKLEAAALAKLYECSTKDFVRTKPRKRSDITRSRGQKQMDQHFSEERNRDLIAFCCSTGLRRSELSRLCGTQLIEQNGLYYIGVKGKGGKYRQAPVIDHVELVVERMKKAGAHKVWEKVHSAADIHAYRAQYATAIYKKYERPLSVCKVTPFYNKHHKTRNKSKAPGYDADSVYRMRGQYAGIWLDKEAMLMASIALGHNRIDVVAEHYIRAQMNTALMNKDTSTDKY